MTETLEQAQARFARATKDTDSILGTMRARQLLGDTLEDHQIYGAIFNMAEDQGAALLKALRQLATENADTMRAGLLEIAGALNDYLTN